ncbi:sigma-70 family RNA polymerase sigma factor [Lawsonibacter sp. NSJ-52]|uniref:Sigma-70 family RNA polymerase sigma factor n=2 Tax=Lawsonibacter faecis TaxID=2763052 RepID=A0A8J6MC41_9FIRM|nr:sigma-70 family RNA polymerase sigma factor [Lawsonibacter faecis]
MFRIANDILHNEQDAEDTVHSAFIKIAENIARVGEPLCPKTKSYVVIIVERKAIDLYRQRQRHGTINFDDEISGISVTYEGDNALTECILKLPARYRQFILLKYHHGYTVHEIAKIFGISHSAASKLDQRAKSRLLDSYMEAVK